MSANAPVSIPLYHRLVSYLHYLKSLSAGAPDKVSSVVIAAALGANDVQVRKDLAIVSDGGKPKIGYVTKALIADLEHYLGHDNCTDAVLVGVGNLGSALLSYENFRQYGLSIVAAFDSSPDVVGTEHSGVRVVDSDKLANLCGRLNVHIGIITVPSDQAQEVCNELVAGGVRAIWNFAPVNLSAPDSVIVKNEDIAASLAVLTKQLAEKLADDKPL